MKGTARRQVQGNKIEERTVRMDRGIEYCWQFVISFVFGISRFDCSSEKAWGIVSAIVTA